MNLQFATGCVFGVLKMTPRLWGGKIGSLGCLNKINKCNQTHPGTWWPSIYRFEQSLGILLMATRNPANSPVEVGSLSHYLQGFIHPTWLFGISSISRKSFPSIHLKKKKREQLAFRRNSRMQKNPFKCPDGHHLLIAVGLLNHVF